MARGGMRDWNAYWDKFKSLAALQEKSNNIDETFKRIEAEFGCKLLSGDHIQIIAALEERIEDLENTQAKTQAGVQADLFESI